MHDASSAHADRRPTLRRRLLAGAVVVVALSIGVPIAWASHIFTDVPTGHQFHTHIAAMQYAGITGGKGCEPPGTPPTYCPGEFITREAMAAFVQRSASRTAFGKTSPSEAVPLTAAESTLAVVTIAIGGVPGRTQTVKLDGVVTVFIPTAPAGGVTPARYFITQDGVGGVSDSHPIQTEFSQAGGETSPVTAVVSVPTGTTQTFRLVARRTSDAPTGTLHAYGALSAITGAFGSSGGE